MQKFIIKKVRKIHQVEYLRKKVEKLYILIVDSSLYFFTIYFYSMLIIIKILILMAQPCKTLYDKVGGSKVL